VGLQKLVLFAAELGFLNCDGFAVLDAVALGTADLVEHDGLDLAALLGGEGDALVDGVDLAFDFVDEDASELAACGVVLAAVATRLDSPPISSSPRPGRRRPQWPPFIKGTGRG
jgi:hypothetical protein